MSARSDPQGYYRALGVPHTATADEIRLAFRASAMASHPDQAGGAGDGETFRLIREAYEVLRDPRRRMAYDASGLAAWEHAPAPGGSWAEDRDERRRGGRGTPSEPMAAPQQAFTAAHDLGPGTERNGPHRSGPGRGGPDQSGSSRSGPGGAGLGGAGPGGAEPSRSGPGGVGLGGVGPGGAGLGGAGSSGHRTAPDAAFAAAERPTPRARRRKLARAGSSRLWPLVAAGLALLLLVVLGSLWSAHRQLDDRQSVVAALYDRLSDLGAEQAELRSRYRSVAFLDLDRALRLGTAGPGTPIGADAVRAVDRFDVTFADSGTDLGPGESQSLARALVAIAGQIDRLPDDAEWLIVLEAQAARATFAEQVAVDSWEVALLRLATVLDALLAQGLPGERLAVRFNAGFAAPHEPLLAGGAAELSAFNRVSIQLLCCID